jgi:hypothetical protein
MFSLPRLLRVLGVSVLGLTWAATAQAQGVFTLTSTTFKDGSSCRGRLPAI